MRHWSEPPPRFAVQESGGFGHALWVSSVTGAIRAGQWSLNLDVGHRYESYDH